MFPSLYQCLPPQSPPSSPFYKYIQPAPCTLVIWHPSNNPSLLKWLHPKAVIPVPCRYQQLVGAGGHKHGWWGDDVGGKWSTNVVPLWPEGRIRVTFSQVLLHTLMQLQGGVLVQWGVYMADRFGNNQLIRSQHKTHINTAPYLTCTVPYIRMPRKRHVTALCDQRFPYVNVLA